MAEWEEESGIPSGLALWTGRTAFKGTQLPRTERVLSIVDTVCAQKIKDARIPLSLIKEESISKIMANCVVDISQNPCRRAFSKPAPDSTNILPCLTSSSRLYAYGVDRMLYGAEHFALQGWDKNNVVAPAGVSEIKLAEMAGQGMFVPSIGSILWSVYCVKQFP